MIETQRVRRTMIETAAKICDRCGLRAEVRDVDFEFCEFISIRHLGGYGSVIGDGARVEIDLCQHCFKALLPFARVVLEEPNQ